MKRLIFTFAFFGIFVPALLAQTYSMNGTFTYNNAANTPLDVVKIVLRLNSIPIDSIVTTGLGYFQFTGLSNNSYSIAAFTTKPWGGVNGTDALMVERHFVGLEMLTVPIKVTAADVNNSGSINGTDAMKIRRRFIGLDTSFDHGNWMFEKVTGGNTVIISGADVTQNFYGLCIGDVNGSNSPLPTMELPTVTTASIINITSNSATGGGFVFSDGGSSVTTRGVCWSNAPSPTIADSHTNDGSGTGTFVGNLTGLAGGVLYHVRAYAMNSLGTSYGNTLTFTTLAPALTCGNPITYAGKNYNTVQIGTQCWFKENLNIGSRINGSLEQTNNGTIEKYCYNDLESNCDIYGGMYQWNEMMQYVTTDGFQGLCPTGWHLPTDAELTLLVNYLGGDGVAGGKMKEAGTVHWLNPNSGATNESGFTALPAGCRNCSAVFNFLTYYTDIWSSTQPGVGATHAYYRTLSYSDTNASRYLNEKTGGFSVRCMKDN